MKLIRVYAEGYYSRAVEESSYLITNSFHKFLKEAGAFYNLGAHELDGKHSYVDAEVEELDTKEVNKLDFSKDYFDDAIFENAIRAAQEIEEDEVDEFMDLNVGFSPEEFRIIAEDSSWEDNKKFREYQVKIAEDVFEVPQEYKDKLSKMIGENIENFFEIAWKNGLLRD